MPRKVRGPTKLQDVWNLGPGEKLPEKFNIYGQCVDNGELEKFCGVVAKTPNLTPLEYKDWRLVPDHFKDQIWITVTVKLISYFNLLNS